jgi:hypothetical protein
MSILIAVDILVAKLILTGYEASNVLIENPSVGTVFRVSESGKITKKFIYGLVGIECEDNYPDIELNIVPPFWIYNREFIGRIQKKYDIAIAPVTRMEPKTGLVKNDNICLVKQFSETCEYVNQRPKVIEEIKKIITDTMNNDPEHLRSQAKEYRDLIDALNSTNSELRSQIASLNSTICKLQSELPADTKTDTGSVTDKVLIEKLKELLK